MTMDRIEENELYRKKSNNNSMAVFNTNGSAGNNPEKLAQILSAYDFFISAMGWSKDDTIANLSTIITQYQASLIGKYHDDFVKIQVAEEIAKKQSERKGVSIFQQQ